MSDKGKDAWGDLPDHEFDDPNKRGKHAFGESKSAFDGLGFDSLPPIPKQGSYFAEELPVEPPQEPQKPLSEPLPHSPTPTPPPTQSVTPVVPPTSNGLFSPPPQPQSFTEGNEQSSSHWSVGAAPTPPITQWKDLGHQESGKWWWKNTTFPVVMSFACGLFALICCCVMPVPVPATVVGMWLGHSANRSEKRLKGKGSAKAQCAIVVNVLALFFMAWMWLTPSDTESLDTTPVPAVAENTDSNPAPWDVPSVAESHPDEVEGSDRGWNSDGY